ncbi:MAG: HlyD family efflux transporter periplasmic adaptor subunit [Deltaproteobacteria bacterium]|nr:HlyD family efflux transporter periplasmic adaptor subunit [Deltaproteobacteria bacterium]
MRRSSLPVVALWIAACAGDPALPPNAADPGPKHIEAPTAPAPQGDPEPLALVVPRHTVALTSTVSGQLYALEVGLGDVVEPGQRLATLVNADLHHAVRLAEASARSSRARLKEARHRERFSRHKARQTESLGEYVSGDERAARRHDARRATAVADSALGELSVEQTTVERLRAQAEALVVRAPFAARVAAVHHDPGQHVPAGEPMLRLVSTEQVVRFAVEAEQLTAFTPGAIVEFSAESTVLPRLLASVHAVAPEVDAAGLVLVEATFIDTDLVAALRSGVHGHVQITSPASVITTTDQPPTTQVDQP